MENKGYKGNSQTQFLHKIVVLYINHIYTKGFYYVGFKSE